MLYSFVCFFFLFFLSSFFFYYDRKITGTNLEKVFARCVGEGKATLRFRQPSVDLCINKAVPADLKDFLAVIALAQQNPKVRMAAH